MNEISYKDRVITKDCTPSFEGNIVAVFTKKSGKYRYVVENDEGSLLIFSNEDLQIVPNKE